MKLTVTANNISDKVEETPRSVSMSTSHSLSLTEKKIWSHKTLTKNWPYYFKTNFKNNKTRVTSSKFLNSWEKLFYISKSKAPLMNYQNGPIQNI